MDTPQKTQIGNPAYDFEESPFSNFINNLSPINPSNSIPVSQTLGALTFTSPPSVFTSPHVTLQKDSTFLRRHQVSELSKPELASDTESKDVTREDAGNAANSPRKGSDEVKDAGPSKDKESEDAPDESSNLAIELPTELKYDCGSPDIQTTSEPGASSSVPLFQEASSGNSLGTHLASVETDENMDGSGGDWGLIDALVFESLQVQEPPKDSEDHSLDEQIDLFASYLSQFPEGEDVNDMEHQHGLSPLSSDVQDQMSQSGPAANKLHQLYHGQDYNGSSSSNVNVTEQISKNLENKVIVHRGIRRRCLVFEIPGAKKNVGGGSISTSSSQDEANILANSAVSALNQGGDSSMCVRPGIGLHLNTLSVSSNGGRVLIPENFSSEKQLITVPPTAVSESFKSSASISLEEIGNAEKEVEVAEDASQASAPGSNEDLNPNSPKKKRRRSENSGEGEGSCKRCNCKKSKCLKLYCECFAAGVYCVEPCACRDCFNKPIHEETVLATRKQIESRNPLAFAPKVIRSDNVNDPGDESNKTPASARHKRGCNCKKSNCLKKYCECYQGGVGCSVNCRCEGCKNTFGRKDGPTFAGMELEAEEDTPAHEKVQPGIHNDEDLNPGSKLPQTPLRLFRPSIPLPSSSKGKPSRFVSVSSCSLLNPDGPGRSTFLRAQHKNDNKQPQEASSVDKLPAFLHNTSPSSNTIKTLSPNSKRISSPHNDNIRTSPGTRSTSRKLILQSIPSFPSLTPRR